MIKPILFSTSMVQALNEGRKTQTRRVVKPQPEFDTAWKNLSLAEKMLDDFGEVTPDADIIPYINVKGNWLGLSKKSDSGLTGTGCVIPNVSVPYHVGDILWVRETWAETTNIHNLSVWPNRPCIITDEMQKKILSAYIWRADGEWQWCDDDGFSTEKSCWKPSIFMPKAACRLFLKVTSVRVERLQDISEADAVGEGVEKYHDSWFYKRYGTDRDWCATAYASFAYLWESINGRDSWDANPWVWVVEFEKTDKPENFTT